MTQLTVASFLVFYAIHYFAKPFPKTMSKEWQEASNEYAKVSIVPVVEYIWGIFQALAISIDRLLTPLSLQSEKINPIHGISAEHYQGEGFVQSPPAEKS